jgi:ferrochelatase
MSHPLYDAVIVVSFGGPEGPDDVLPFLRNVVRGRDVPPARLERVAEQYHALGGVSPINGINRALVAALTAELASEGIELPVFWGNRNWAPFLVDEVRAMRDAGVRRALAFVTSPYGSYSSCRQYLDDIARARVDVGAGAPEIDKLRLFYDHPSFREVWVDALNAALQGCASPPTDDGSRPTVLFSAHSIPLSMATTSNYEAEIAETATAVAEGVGLAPGGWRLVWQSRSGSPGQPWLEPDLLDVIAQLPDDGQPVVVAPIGFVADHMEVVYDLDTQASAAAAAGGHRLIRAATPGLDSRFVSMIRLIIEERLEDPELVGVGCPPAHCPAARR